MTLPQYYELCRYWAKNPPISIIARAIGVGFGVLKPPPETPPSASSVAISPPASSQKSSMPSVAELKAMYPGGIIIRR